jgi:hypothetical protein
MRPYRRGIQGAHSRAILARLPLICDAMPLSGPVLGAAVRSTSIYSRALAALLRGGGSCPTEGIHKLEPYAARLAIKPDRGKDPLRDEGQRVKVPKKASRSACAQSARVYPRLGLHGTPAREACIPSFSQQAPYLCPFMGYQGAQCPEGLLCSPPAPLYGVEGVHAGSLPAPQSRCPACPRQGEGVRACPKPTKETR